MYVYNICVCMVACVRMCRCMWIRMCMHMYYVYRIRMHNAYCALCAHVCDYFICKMYVCCANNFCKDSKQN